MPYLFINRVFGPSPVLDFSNPSDLDDQVLVRSSPGNGPACFCPPIPVFKERLINNLMKGST